MPLRQPVLIMIQGPEPGSIFRLPDNRVTTIGRSSRNTIRAVSPSVSRFHCEIAWINGRWELNDLNSKRGSIVNGERVADKWALAPGDIIRLSTTVFRFDMIDETVLQDGAMVAIMEAELDQRLITKGEAIGALEDIRARSRLEGEYIREERLYRRRTLRTNVAFVAVVAAVVGLAVTGLLFYVHRQGAGLPGQTPPPAGQDRAELLWSTAQEKLALVTAREAEDDYAGALRIYEELERLSRDELLIRLLKRRRQYTDRLARASFRTTEQIAQRHLEEGNSAAALELYQAAGDRIGLPELVARARQKIAELKKGASG